MKKSLEGYLIEKYDNMGEAYTCKRIIAEAQKQDIRIQLLGVQDTYVQNGKLYNKGRLLENRDFVINRYKGGAIKDEINALAARQYNPQQGFQRYVNKYYQMKDLKLTGCNMPRYILSTCGMRYMEIKERLGDLFVAKGLNSSEGKEVFLITNKDEYYDLKKFGIEKEWLFEEYIQESCGRDIRFFSLRGQVIACMTREAESGFRANVALGASVKRYEINKYIESVAEEIYQQTQLDFLGIDLLFGNEKPFFCEINVMPGLVGIESATGVNVAKKIVDMIAGDYRNGEMCGRGNQLYI